MEHHVQEVIFCEVDFPLPFKSSFSALELQADLRDTAGSLSDHYNKPNKANINTWMFLLPSTYKSYVYARLSSIKCAVALCLKT